MNPFPRRRVVVTGCGIVTPLGLGWAENAEGFRQGRACFAPVSLFDVSRQRCRLAAEVPSRRLDEAVSASRVRAKRGQRWDRATKLWLAAAEEAWRQSGNASGQGVASYVGTTSGGMALGEALLRQAGISRQPRQGQPSQVYHYLAYQPVVEVARLWGWTGPVRVAANACASGASAVAHAWRDLSCGRRSVVIAGGFDALAHLVFAGFDSLQALSLTGCRPFAANRDGLLLGEGAAALVLETLEFDKERGAPIFGEIAGVATATDLHHLTQPDPGGNAATRCLVEACRVAGWDASEVDYLNAHGTGTVLNDASESAAITSWAGVGAGKLAVSSIKGSIGHTLGAAGAIEAVACFMAMDGHWLPPQVDAGALDPCVTFDVVRSPRSRVAQRMLSNSFGFGGANACLALRRWA